MGIRHDMFLPCVVPSKNTTTRMQTNWRLRVRRELNTIENWEQQWGFLKAAPMNDSLDNFASSHHAVQTSFALGQLVSLKLMRHCTGDTTALR